MDISKTIRRSHSQSNGPTVYWFQHLCALSIHSREISESFLAAGGKAEANAICITTMHVLKSTHKSMVWLDLYSNDEDN